MRGMDLRPAAVAAVGPDFLAGVHAAADPLQSPWQFRVGPPPSLTSHRYARDLNEVQDWGGATSKLRTPEQTAVAQFWTANATSQTNVMMAGIVSCT